MTIVRPLSHIRITAWITSDPKMKKSDLAKKISFLQSKILKLSFLLSKDKKYPEDVILEIFVSAYETRDTFLNDPKTFPCLYRIKKTLLKLIPASINCKWYFPALSPIATVFGEKPIIVKGRAFSMKS